MLTLSPEWAALVLAGILIHLFADWFLQNDWMAKNKAKRWITTIMLANWRWDHPDKPGPPGYWWFRHPAAYVHAGIHTLALLLVFPVWACLLIGVLHLIIDTRSPLDWWGKFTRQTRVQDKRPWGSSNFYEPIEPLEGYMDIGMEVAFWRDQVAHFVVIALVALAC